MKNNKKSVKLRGKQIMVVGLIALVLSAGYYRWTIGALRSDAVGVSSTTLPSDNNEKEETFFNKSDENKEDNKEDNKEETNDSEKSDDATYSGDILARSRQERDALRGDVVDKWKEIASNKDAAESTKKQAEENVIKQTKQAENENNIETAIKSKGFEDCYAKVSDSGVSVIVKGGNLDNSTVAQIKDIIIDETGVDASQIKISSEQ